MSSYVRTMESKKKEKQETLNLHKLEQKFASSLEWEEIVVKGYERVCKVTHKKVGLTAIIALHNTTLGPGLGGVRIYPYATIKDALEDVLRLSKGMTYKSAITEVGFGGAKAVIIADPKTDKNEDLLLAFGEAVHSLQGKYICAEDVGCTIEDVMVIRRATPYVVGLPHEKASGDPGKFTAWGTFRGIQSVCFKLFGTEALEGKRVAVQGLGNVGFPLTEYLFWAGADLIVADIDQEKAERVAKKWGAKFVPAAEIEKVECEIFAPCAMGGIINDKTLRTLQCKAIAGSANNQLLREDHATALMHRSILYAPDFVINGGGLLNVVEELEEMGYQPKKARRNCHKIYNTLLTVYEIAEKNGISTHHAAVALANYRLQYGIGKREQPPHFLSL